MNRSYVQPRFRCTGQGFIVLAQPATTSQPRQCSLNHPPSWQHLKLMAGPGTLDDLQDPARHGHHPVHQLAAVASVSPDESKAWESSYQFIDDQPRTISVLDIGRMHHHRQQQAHGIYDDVSLSTVDLLTSITMALRRPNKGMKMAGLHISHSGDGRSPGGWGWGTGFRPPERLRRWCKRP